VVGVLARLRAGLARALVRAARIRERRSKPLADRLLRWALRLEPQLADAAPALVRLRRAAADRLGAVAAARSATVRFPESADAWFLLGEASEGAFKRKEAMDAYARALGQAERADAAFRTGSLLRRESRYADAAAMFARAFAAGAGPEALYENAAALWHAGDTEQALRALEMWGTHFADGPARVADARRELERGAKPA
jgi:tetratricopeptide (TPR) repeat protein